MCGRMFRRVPNHAHSKRHFVRRTNCKMHALSFLCRALVAVGVPRFDFPDLLRLALARPPPPSHDRDARSSGACIWCAR